MAEVPSDIPLVDVAWQHRQVRAEIDQGINQLLADPTCDGIEIVKQLESEFTLRIGQGVLAVSVQSGTAAEFPILRALGIGEGDEVITVPNSDLATTAAISHTGATP
jgi:dTDP-4-amino-4,6-dideoxygalactose transaminase